jgi:hypothetical protein
MKLSEALEKLNAIYKEHGDIDLKVYPYDGQMNPKPAGSIEVDDKEVVLWNANSNMWETQSCPKYVCIWD